MKRFASSFTVLGVGLAAALSLASANPTFSIKSAAFADGGTIPVEYVNDGYGCVGKNVSPELSWSRGPGGTKSFAITTFDPDAHGGWWHWVVYGIPAGTHAIAKGESIKGAIEGVTTFGKAGYGGPCPPPGDSPHHYEFTVYALDFVPAGTSTGSPLDGPALVKALKGHILAKATIVGRFGR